MLRIVFPDITESQSDRIDSLPNRCPQCRRSFGLHIPALSGRVGPKLYRCRWCENVTQSHREEWPTKSRRERRGYYASSAIFALAMATLSTIAGVLWIGYFDSAPPRPTWIVANLGAVAIAAALWQAGRVFFSLQRDGEGSIDPRDVSFISPLSNSLWSIVFPLAVGAIMVLVRKSFHV